LAKLSSIGPLLLGLNPQPFSFFFQFFAHPSYQLPPDADQCRPPSPGLRYLAFRASIFHPYERFFFWDEGAQSPLRFSPLPNCIVIDSPSPFLSRGLSPPPVLLPWEHLFSQDTSRFLARFLVSVSKCLGFFACHRVPPPVATFCDFLFSQG